MAVCTHFPKENRGSEYYGAITPNTYKGECYYEKGTSYVFQAGKELLL